MREYAPSGYEDFSCTGSRCRHNCCIGWEIDIDRDSLQRYLQMDGPLGDRLKAAVIPGNPACFRMDSAGRCAMLDHDNLCALQRQLGEKALCHICADHPRYRVFFPDRTEIGLGMCCEEAARQMLARTEKTVMPIGSEPLSRRTRQLLRLRELLLRTAQDRSLPIAGRMRKLLLISGAALPRRSRKEWCRAFSSLEALEDAWSALWQEFFAAEPDYEGFRIHMKEREHEYEQLLVYFLLRHFLAEDGRNLSARCGFAVLCTGMIWVLGAAQWTRSGSFSTEDQTELCRLWSANIEYSEENMSLLLS